MRRMIGATAMLAACLAATTPTRAAPPEDSGPAVNLPLDEELQPAELTTSPGASDLEREYPPVALRIDLGGSSTMTCRTLPSGLLDDCHVVSETPAGAGFGVAEIRTAAYFRVKPAMRDGQPVVGSITIPMRWQMGSRTPAPPRLEALDVSPSALALAREIVALEDVQKRITEVWQPFLKTQAALSKGSGNGDALVKAFQDGLTEVAGEEADRQAHELAAKESGSDLRAIVAFLQSPPGRAWNAAQTHMIADAPTDLTKRIGDAARARYCAKAAC